MHTDSPQNQRDECTSYDLVLPEQLFDSDVATAQAEDDDCDAEEANPDAHEGSCIGEDMSM